jgi:hypothetical protein
LPTFIDWVLIIVLPKLRIFNNFLRLSNKCIDFFTINRRDGNSGIYLCFQKGKSADDFVATRCRVSRCHIMELTGAPAETRLLQFGLRDAKRL